MEGDLGEVQSPEDNLLSPKRKMNLNAAVEVVANTLQLMSNTSTVSEAEYGGAGWGMTAWASFHGQIRAGGGIRYDRLTGAAAYRCVHPSKHTPR